MVARVLGVLAVLAALSVPVQASPCGVPVGRVVTLKSTELDPDVFVWDAKQRMVDYAGGDWVGGTSGILKHTLLAKPGTRAVIVQCSAGIIHPKYAADTRDAIGIKLTNGPNKGRYGWVTSDDIHQIVAGR